VGTGFLAPFLMALALALPLAAGRCLQWP